MTDTPQPSRPYRSTLRGVPAIITDAEEARRYLTDEYPSVARLLEECEREEIIRQAHRKRATIGDLLEQYLGMQAEISQSNHREEGWAKGRRNSCQRRSGSIIARVATDDHNPAIEKRRSKIRQAERSITHPGSIVEKYEEAHGPIIMNPTEKIFCANMLEQMRGMTIREMAVFLTSLDDNAQMLVLKTLMDEEARAEGTRREIKDTITVGNRKTQARIYIKG